MYVCLEISCKTSPKLRSSGHTTADVGRDSVAKFQRFSPALVEISVGPMACSPGEILCEF